MRPSLETYSLLLGEQVLELKLPQPLEDYCHTDAKALMLASTASAFLLREQGGHPEYLTPLRYHLAFAKSWRDGTSFAFERVFIPAEQDWQSVRLPRPLRFLYYLVRPIRFVVERLSMRRVHRDER